MTDERQRLLERFAKLTPEGQWVAMAMLAAIVLPTIAWIVCLTAIKTIKAEWKDSQQTLGDLYRLHKTGRYPFKQTINGGQHAEKEKTDG